MDSPEDLGLRMPILRRLRRHEAPARRRERRMRLVVALMLALATTVSTAADEVRRNWFNDPFAQATAGMSACPRPAGPLLTEAEMRRQAHQRVERGTTCWLEGKCAEPNAYADDARINEAAARALGGDARLRDTSLWVITQRRFLFVQGCVRSAPQRRLVIETLRRLPGVEYVGDDLLVGAAGRPPYPVATDFAGPAARN